MRVTEGLVARSVLMNNARTLARFADAQNRIASGKNILRPSDDPLMLAKILEMKSQAARLSAHGDNASEAVGFMSVTESSLGEISDLLSRAKELVLSGINASTDTTAAGAQGDELRTMIDSLLLVANRDFAGKSLFGGQKTSAPPYVNEAGVVTYQGDSASLLEELGPGLRVLLNLTGPDAFETVTSRLEGGVDLNPALSTITPLSELLGGDGVEPGFLRVTDSNGVAADLDLSGAKSVGDLLDGINNAGLAVTATLSADGNSILLTDSAGGSSFTVEDLNGSDLAQSLGLATTSTTGEMEGVDLNPVLSESTPVALLLGGAGLAAGTWRLTSSNDAGQKNATIDPTTANTVGDLLDLIEGAETEDGESLRLRARIEGNVLQIESIDLHTTIRLSDTTSPGSAGSLGIAGEGKPRDVFALLADAAEAVTSRDAEAMDTILADLSTAIDRTAGMRGLYGARSRQVLDLKERITDEGVDLTIRLADLEDADIAQAALELNQSQAVYNASLAAGAYLYDRSLFDYIR